MSASPCQFLARSPEAYRLTDAGEQVPAIVWLCEHADQQPARYSDLPVWIQRAAIAGAGVDPIHDCAGCACFERAPAIELSAEERKFARHALGLPNERGQSYRNRYYAAPGSHRHDIWAAIVGKGGATQHADGNISRPCDLFVLTERGAIAALLPGERLCSEDFPSEVSTLLARALPADLIATAAAIVAAFPPGTPSPDDVRHELAKAMLAERHRCAEACRAAATAWNETADRAGRGKHPSAYGWRERALAKAETANNLADDILRGQRVAILEASR
jgi:hypothetical protein